MYKILVVDDRLDVRNTLKAVLIDAGYDVQLASNEGEALNAVLNERFDLAIIDVRLRGEDEDDESGLSLALAFRTLDPEIRIILLSRYQKNWHIARAIRYHGVLAFIEKKDKTNKSWSKEIIEKIEAIKKNNGYSKFEIDTRMVLSFTENQFLTVRAHGRHVYSTRTSNAFQLEVENYARKAEIESQNRTNLRFHIQDTGRNLWREIFIQHRELDNVFRESRAKSQLLSLLIEAPRDFLRLPLEFMFLQQPETYMILEHPFARFIYNAVPKRETISPQLLALKKKLNVLIIASNTQPQIGGVDDETKKLCNYLNQQDIMPVDVELIPTEQATYERVRSELRKNSYDIIHYAGHGLHNVKSPEESSVLFWSQENRKGDIIQMKATELKMLLEFSSVHLLYLSCCSGSATSSDTNLLDGDFLGIADAVAQAGVPSVIGFRWPVSDEGALSMALEFYRSLIEHGSPEVALWLARRALAAIDPNDTTWLAPILVHQQ